MCMRPHKMEGAETAAEAASPIERVTNSHKNKDPKKVAAGQKGAAARKAKEEALREQPRKSKDKIQPSSPPARAPTKAPPEAEHSSWIPYSVLAGAVVIGALLLSAQKPADVVRAREPAVLNRQSDAFYMR